VKSLLSSRRRGWARLLRGVCVESERGLIAPSPRPRPEPRALFPPPSAHAHLWRIQILPSSPFLSVYDVRPFYDFFPPNELPSPSAEGVFAVEPQSIGEDRDA